MTVNVNRLSGDEKDLRELVLMVVDDLVSDFAYYDRKEDFELSLDDLENAIGSQIITPEEIIDRFAEGIRKTWGNYMMSGPLV